MRNLFLKIFLWFWLTVVGVAVALAASVTYATHAPRVQLQAAADNMPAAAKAAAEKFERGGRPALAGFLSDIEMRYPVIAFFFDADGRELLDHTFSADVRRAAAAAKKESVYLRGNITAHRAAGPSGRDYSLVLLLNPDSPSAVGKAGFLKFAVLFLPIVTLVVGAGSCFLITRHITSPLFRLRAAAGEVAKGSLETRVTPKLGRRRDEIAALGRDFDRMTERLEALVAGHKRLLGDVSHELRSPLSRLVVALGLARKASAPELDECFNRIALEANRLDQLIGQLLTLSRIDSGSLSSASTEFNLSDLVREVAGDADFEARAHWRRVTVNSMEEYVFTGSEELLRSAIENVVRNAIRLTRENTAVEMSLERQDRRLVLRVRDHGPGLPENMLSDIFLPFRRFPNEAGTAGEGAGLGLAIAQRAVAANGGHIEAINAKDGGLIVVIELPAM